MPSPARCSDLVPFDCADPSSVGWEWGVLCLRSSGEGAPLMRAGVRNKEQDHPAPPPAHRRRPCLAVIQSPPGWEVGVYAAGALALLGIAAVSLWRLWASGSFPSPSPFPNYDYRYLQRKYGEASAEAGRKVRLLCPQVHPRLPPCPCCAPSASAFVPSPLMSPLGMRARPTLPYAPAAPSQGGKEGWLPSSEAACGAGCLRWPPLTQSAWVPVPGS